MSADTISKRPVAAAKPPTAVQAAVILTWLGSAAAAGLTVVTTVFWLFAFSDVFDQFDSGTGNPRFALVVAALVVVALSAIASYVAWRLMRGEAWAYWGLLALCAVSVVLGVVAFGFVLPPLVGLAAIVVAVLLLLPSSRAWFRPAVSASTV